MARCSTKGCVKGATKRIVFTDFDGNSKGRPICQDCLAVEIHSPLEQRNVKVIDVNKKHHQHKQIILHLEDNLNTRIC